MQCPKDARLALKDARLALEREHEGISHEDLRKLNILLSQGKAALERPLWDSDRKRLQ
jgi:hypothetical protein